MNYSVQGIFAAKGWYSECWDVVVEGQLHWTPVFRGLTGSQ